MLIRLIILGFLLLLTQGSALELPGKGESSWFSLHAGTGFDGREATIPYYVARSHKSGPVLIVLAGVHGDEISGVLAARRLISSPRAQPRSGTLVIVPVANPPGFVRQSRYFPDRKDMNRSFPGSPYGSEASRHAHLIFREIVSDGTHVIDLHSAAIGRTNFPQTRGSWKEESEAVYQMGQAFGAPLMIQSSQIEGSLRALCHARDKPYLLYEAGEARRTDSHSTEVAVSGVLNVMAWLEMIEPVAEPVPKSEVLKHSTWLRAVSGGIMERLVEPGAYVEAGAPLYLIHQPMGRETVEVAAPYRAWVIGLVTEGLIREGDALVHLGMKERKKP